MVVNRQQFKRRLRQTLDDANRGSDRKVSKLSGLSPTSIHSWLAYDKPNQKDHGPGAFSLAAVCATLDVDIRDLLGLNPSSKPSFDALISHWHNSGKQLSALSAQADHFDVFHLPKPGDSKLSIYRLGKKSLATQTTGIIARHFFQETMNTFTNEAKRKEIIADYTEMNYREVDISIKDLHVPAIAHLTTPVDLQYQRLLLRVTDNSHQLVVNYSIAL